MDVNPWIPLLHELGTIIAATAAAIAAVSSLKNGKTLNGKIKPDIGEIKSKVTPTSLPKNGSKDSAQDWYQPPEF